MTLEDLKIQYKPPQTHHPFGILYVDEVLLWVVFDFPDPAQMYCGQIAPDLQSEARVWVSFTSLPTDFS